MRRSFILSLALLLTLAVSQVQVQGAYSASLPSSGVALSGTRSVPLAIKIVFIGLQPTDINTTYLTSIVNLPSEKPQSVLYASQTTGSVTFKLTYQESFANASVTTAFAAYLQSIQRVQQTQAGVFRNTNPPENPYFDNSTTSIGTVNNYFYDANKVETWLNSSKSFGPNPVPGYTLFIADLHNIVAIPSFTYAQYQQYNTKCSPCSSQGSADAHYYNNTVVDPDLGLAQTSHFMTGWGGDSRFYFLDLSAGPSYRTNELPIQVAQSTHALDPSSPYAKVWRTEFVADYVVGTVYNLFSPDQVYPVSYSDKYVFHLFVIDGRSSGEISNHKISTTLNITMMQNQLAGLVPFAKVTVIPTFHNLTYYPALARVIANATTTIRDTSLNRTMIDARPVYNWLSVERHLSQFVNATPSTTQIDVPEFIFAFTGDYDFGFTFKEDIGQGAPGFIYGVALGDLVLISHGQSDFDSGLYDKGTGRPQLGKGLGYTHTIIHESGHMLGLPHPFQYDPTEDFVNSVMGYYPNANSYSQFDRDLELRGINDELLLFAQVTLAGTSSTLFNVGSISAARQAMVTAEQKYSAMDYAGAVAYSLSAAENAASAQQSSSVFSAFSGVALFLVVGILVGAAIGLVAGFLVFRKRAPGGLAYYHCPTCNRPLRWDPAMMRWYCDYCQKPV